MAKSFSVDEDRIREEVNNRQVKVYVKEDYYTPAGNRRNTPMFVTTICNNYLNKTRRIKTSIRSESYNKAKEQIEKWKQQEIKARISALKEKQTENAETYYAEKSQESKTLNEALKNILISGFFIFLTNLKISEIHF